MANPVPAPRRVSRITCQVHGRLGDVVKRALTRLGVDSALGENGRTVREMRTSRPFGLPGSIVRLDDAPSEIFRITVPTDAESTVIEALIRAAELDAPGHGSIFSQRLNEYGNFELPEILDGGDRGDRRAGADRGDAGRAREGQRGVEPRDAGRPQTRTLLHDLTLITCILSMPGSGEQVARVALDLGSCVPVVTLGRGTGVRDRLGLLRITIPVEKEIVRLLVPEHDANEIMRLLIEEARLDRPGRGFLYRTPVEAALLDTSLRIGRQEHAASIEQIIAAVDELKRGTSWRRRFAAIERSGGDPTQYLRLGNREIALISGEGRTSRLIEAAIAAGAGGATTSRVRRLNLNETDSGGAPRERSVLSVPGDKAEAIVEAMVEAGAIGEDRADRIQVLDAPAAFAHGRRPN